jgi:hypothetical protein
MPSHVFDYASPDLCEIVHMNKLHIMHTTFTISYSEGDRLPRQFQWSGLAGPFLTHDLLGISNSPSTIYHQRPIEVRRTTSPAERHLTEQWNKVGLDGAGSREQEGK